MDKKAQGGLAIGLIAFWLIFALSMTLYSYSDFPAINGLGGALNYTVINTPVNQTTTSEGETGFWGFFTGLGRIMGFILAFVTNMIALLTFWFPVFDSIIVTGVIGVMFLVMKVATWWVLIRFWV